MPTGTWSAIRTTNAFRGCSCFGSKRRSSTPTRRPSSARSRHSCEQATHPRRPWSSTSGRTPASTSRARRSSASSSPSFAATASTLRSPRCAGARATRLREAVCLPRSGPVASSTRSTRPWLPPPIDPYRRPAAADAAYASRVVTCPSCGSENSSDAKFCSECGTRLAPAVRPVEERKTVTVVFCDLVGSTARAERLDPEDVRAELSSYHARVRSELERHGGSLEKFIGDAVVAVFGAPRVHEDDAE